MQGKVLIRKEINSQDAVSVSNLAKGIYIYNVRTEKQNYKGKVVISD
ncbi:MAG: T9SS type A sorting domain-containing protein [Bacteroidales bacterium]|nr:T9SS type A sorting domain-containing protein [Bacteroidales bacterium]